MAEPIQLLNVFDIETENGPTSLLCFLDPVLAGIKGIEPRSIIGLYGAAEGEDFNPDTFEVNPAFVESITGYMNEEAATSKEIVEQAAALPEGWLYIIDPRDPNEGQGDPPAGNLLGAYAVDDAGQIVPNSFQYNKNHALFDRTHGLSGVLYDKKFYKWLHNVE
jgi:hypothetical protein